MTFAPNTALFCAQLIRELYDGTLSPNVVDRSTDTQALVYRGDSGMVYVVFPGTASLTDWKTDARIAKCAWLAGRVHVGFRTALLSVMGSITDALRPLDWIVVAGHSLGGALAMLCAHQLARRYERVATVVTFGQPRVGNWAFARDYDSILHDETFRIVNAGDPVPKVPFVFGSYKHAGTEVYLPTPEADDPQEAIIEHPWWTSVREAGQTLQTMSQAGGARPDLTQLSLNFPHHSIASYIAKLEQLS